MSDMDVTQVKEDTQPVPPVKPIPYPPPPPEQRRNNGGCGCWIPALLTVFVVGVLVVVGLFLPPVDLWNRLFGTQYAVLSAEANAVADSGLTLVVDPANPGQNFGVALQAMPVNQFLSGSSEAAWLTAARAAVPPNLALQSPVYTLQTSGTAPDTVTLDITIPASAGSPELLSLYGWHQDRATWRFLPSQRSASGTIMTTLSNLPDQVALFQAAPPQQPTVLVTVDVVQNLRPEVGQIATIVAPAGLQPTLQGTLTGSLAAGFDQTSGYLVLPVVRNFTDPRALDPETVTAILSNRSLRSEHVAQIASFASTGFDGILIDYRDLPADQRANFSAFVRELGAAFDNLGLLLGVVVPAAESVEGRWETGPYDWRAIGQAADLVQINLGLDPTTFAPGQDKLVEALLRWSVGEIERHKLLIGLSARSIREAAGSLTAIGYAEALAGLGNVVVEAETTAAGTILPGTEIRASLDGFQAVSELDIEAQAPYIQYLDENDNPVARVWLTTGAALRYRLDRTVPFALGGVAFNDLLAGGTADDVLPAIMNYKLQIPAASTPRDLALRWRIESAGGVVSEVTTSLNEDLIVTLEAPDGNYAVNVEVVDGDASIPRSGQAVALYAPTATPTQVPTATPTPSPTPTQQVVAAAPPASSSGPVAPSAGNIVVGNFEYGGHVTSTASERAAQAMRRAGMTWMKVQVRYGSGMGPASVSGIINDAKARGFKVLIAVVGSPGELGSGGTGYMDQFASFLGGVAGLGPDAIEVWNEPNIDREWPRGQISGAMYADLLRRAYQAIKSANGSVMVISGAPAPTGAEAAFPGQVMNDDNWIRQMVDAGGLQYMDCLGAHYNEGIVGPTQRSGDPRDNYYTRYFYGMLDTYWNLIGGQKPICFTELGFLTPAGYPPLPGFFSWAQNVTLDQHAAWLADAAALASQSGRVRLMIVWNVDFTVYGSDPQAGYAMIRADGSCPACDAMARAR
jgi:spore germination protein YaaH